jgi:L-ascorbate metabolism protein UlaG (beta-lactamase superfamily)
MLKGTSMWTMLKEYRNKPADNIPPTPIPSIRTDLNSLSTNQATIVWFGHSSYLLQLGTTRILVDPVLSGNASPVSFFAKAFPGADLYKPQDMPETLDAILLTHDHYDHLDYKTIQLLNPRTRHFYTSLGVGAHLQYWGVPTEKITELDWWESVTLDPTGLPIPSGTPTSPDSLHLTATPARHFSGRTFKRGGALWSSFVLNAPNPETVPATNTPNPEGNRLNLFLGGDSGYAPHIKSIAEKFAPFDLALLECGQYGTHWPHIHTTPEETLQAAKELRAKVLLPVHWAKFSLALHPWNEPIRRLKAAAANTAATPAAATSTPTPHTAAAPNAAQAATPQFPLITTPRIGEPVIINHNYPADPWYDPNRMESGSKK